MVNSFIVVEMTATQGVIAVLIGLFLIIVIDFIDYLIDKK
jgi:hypothetical protein